jgi:hypothetical protein
MSARRHLATAVLSATVARSGTGSAADSVVTGSVSATALVFVTALVSGALVADLDSASGDLVSAGVGAGIRGGGDGARAGAGVTPTHMGA